MTSSNGNTCRVTGPSCGNIPVTGELPSERWVTQNFGVFFDLPLNRRLNKQSRRRRLEMPSRSRSFWHHYRVVGLWDSNNISGSTFVCWRRNFQMHVHRDWVSDSFHYSDVTMRGMVSQITGNSTVYLTRVPQVPDKCVVELCHHWFR